MFSYDGPVYRLLKNISDVVILHLLWLLTSLPVITLGASTCALYHVSMRRKANTVDAPLSSLFLKTFGRCWKRATALFALLLAAAGLLGLNLYFWNYVASGVFAECVAIACTALCVPLGLVIIYAPAVLAWKGNLSVTGAIKTSLWTAYLHPAYSCVLVVCWTLAVLLNLATLYVNVMFLFIGFGVFVNAFLARTLLSAIDPEAAKAAFDKV